MTSYWETLLGAQVSIIRGKYSTRVIHAGQGDPLLLLHGTGGHAENYIRNIMPLAEHFHVFAMDFLWHGRSETKGFDPEIVPPLVDQISDVLDTLGLSDAHIEGQSLGGWVAMRFALAHPNRVKKLVLTTTMGYEPKSGAVPGYLPPDRSRTLEDSLRILRDPSFENVRSRLARILAHPEHLPDEAVAIRQNFYNDPAVNAVQQRFITHYLGGPEPQKHILTDSDVAKIAAPTLVYWGDKNTVPPSVGKHLSNHIPSGRFFSAPETGHWAQYESYEIHNRKVIDFLREPA